VKLYKYASDWRLENVEKNGKVKTVPVYRGDWYRFTYPDKAASFRVRAAVCTVLLVVTALATLFFRIDTFRTWYANMPYYISLFFLIFLADTVIRHFRAGSGRIKREDAEKIWSRFMIDSFFGLFFVSASIIGCAAAGFSRGSLTGWDWAFLSCLLIDAAVYVYLLVHKDAFKTEKE